MNKERLLLLADHIEQQPHTSSISGKEGFNMASFFHQCGTPSCIAGHATALSLGMGASDAIQERGAMTVAEEWLDLSIEQSCQLFLPTELLMAGITPAHAARVLRNLSETGKVDWVKQL